MTRPVADHPGRSSVPVLLVAGTLLALMLAVVLLPALGALRQVMAVDAAAPPSTEMRAFSVSSIWTTLWVCLLVGVLSTVVAWPVAWGLRGGPGGVLRMLVPLPLLLPTFLAYTGWGMVRGPGSTIGDWLARAPAWVDVLFSQSLAIGGLVLWSWPLAAMVLWMGVSRVPDALTDIIRIEPVGPVRRTLVLARLVAPWVAGGAAVVALVMAGSAIPLHLAQIPTLAIHVWRFLTLSTQPGEVWFAAAPLLLLAAAGGLAGAWALERALPAPGGGMVLINPETMGRRGRAWSWALLVLSVGVPILMFAMMLRDRGLILRFWSTSGGAVGHSLVLASVVGGLGAAIAASVAGLATLGGSGVRRGLRVGLVAALALLLVPGVLIGQAVLGVSSAPWVGRQLARSDVWIALAHLARFGGIAWIAGWLLAAQETPEERYARVLACGESIRGWIALRLVPSLPVVFGVGLALGALSIHEIEATVLLSRPGSGNLAQRLLDLLHYAKDEQLSAAGVNVIGVSAVFGVLGAWMLRPRWRAPARQLGYE